MYYWNSILKEIEAKKSGNYVEPTIEKLCNRDKYFLGKKYKGVYFLSCEAKCMKLLLLGNCYKEIAKILDLSKRTVETYTFAMRKKMSCSDTEQLIEKVSKSDFLKNYESHTIRDN